MPGHILAVLLWFGCADVPRHQLALVIGDVNAPIGGHVFADVVRDLLAVFVRDLLASRKKIDAWVTLRTILSSVMIYFGNSSFKFEFESLY